MITSRLAKKHENNLLLRVKAYKFRLYPTRKQEGTLTWTLRRCKELYNAGLEERSAAYRMGGRSITYRMQSAQLPSIKEERPEYRQIHSQVEQDVLRRLDKAFQAFFRRVEEGQTPGYPRYKSNSRYHSFTYPQGGFEILGMPTSLAKGKTKTCRLALAKIGHVKIRIHRPIKGIIRTCTIKRDGDHWYAVFCVEERFDQPLAALPAARSVSPEQATESHPSGDRGGKRPTATYLLLSRRQVTVEASVLRREVLHRLIVLHKLYL